MKLGQLFWGSLLVALGGLFLFREQLPFSLTWSLIRNLWPIGLILAGVVVLLRNPPVRMAVAILAGVLAAVLVFGMMTLLVFGETPEGTLVDSGGERLSVPLRPDVTRALLSAEVGVTRLDIRQGSEDLAGAIVEAAGGSYVLENDSDGPEERVRFAFEPRGRAWGPWHGENRAEVLLNSTPEWEVDLECGASTVDLDLRGLRVTTVTISAGGRVSTLFWMPSSRRRASMSRAV